MIQFSDSEYALQAYRAALDAVGNSDPNPAVGALIIDANGQEIARGATQRAGFFHAERQALSYLPETDLSKATMFVTLEPCCHHGRTPPCVDAIVERGIGRVVITQRDFAAEVKGMSVQLLQQRGIDVKLLPPAAFEKEAWFTTGPFFFARTYGRPRITLKWAQTNDGALAPISGPSGAISGRHAAYITAALRSIHKFTLASPGAVREDAPRLNVRFPEETPVLTHSGLSDFFLELLLKQQQLIEHEHKAGQTQYKLPSRGFLADASNPKKRAEFEAVQAGLGGDYHLFPFLSPAWRSDFSGNLTSVLQMVLQKGFNSVLIEAGPKFSELLLQHDFVDAVAVYHSREKTADALWGNPGRSTNFASEISHRTPTGFSLVEHAQFAEDDFYLFRRDR